MVKGEKEKYMIKLKKMNAGEEIREKNVGGN